MSVCLVAIAKDEGRFLAEWLAHYFAIGVDRIFLFDNESADETARIVDAAAAEFPVTRIPWPSRPGRSPQVTAYNHAVAQLAGAFDWVCFFDCDEFLVLLRDRSMRDFLRRFPPTVGAVGINWLSFGSSGLRESEYELVTETFRRGGRRYRKNNRHIKTIARVACIDRVGVHDCTLRSGELVHPDGQPLLMSRKRGIADRVDHSLAQLNHYQIKSRADFDAKMRKGRAGKASDNPTRFRADPDDFFATLDNNEMSFAQIDRTREVRLAALAAIRAALARRGVAPGASPAPALRQGRPA